MPCSQHEKGTMKQSMTIQFPPGEEPSHHRALKDLEMARRSVLSLFRGPVSNRRRARQKAIVSCLDKLRELIEYDEFLKATQNQM